MIKNLLIACNVLFVCSVVYGGGPVYRHKEPEKQLEFENVYNDIRGIARISSSTLPGGSTQYMANSNNLPSGSTSYIQNGTANQPSANFNISTGTINQLNQTNSISGGIVDLAVTNNSNTASSHAYIETSVGGTSAGDSVYTARINGGNGWAWGLDNSDSDSWKLSNGTALGTNDAIAVTTAGEMTRPLQPSFLVTATGADANVTGDGTVYPILWNTEVTDRNSDFASSTFTAPVSGDYMLCVGLNFEGVLVTHNDRTLKITTSNRVYIYEDSFLVAQPYFSMQECVIADMDSADTAFVSLSVSGSTKVVDKASGGTANFFMGTLLN